jgi:PAS domain S-box-containing protein
MGVADVVAKGRDWAAVEFAHFLQAGTWRGELELQRKDGSLVAVEVQATPVELPSGTIYVSILRDITARKQVEEQLAFQADVLSQVSDAVIAIDNKHQITYWNPAAEQLYGFTAAEVLGRPVEEVTHYQWFNPADEPAAYETLTARSSWQGENWHATRHGEPLHVESTVSVLKDTAERPIGLLAVIRDITERKRAEEAEYFLTQSSAILASSLDYGTTIEQIVRLAVPTLADWCTLDILEEGHSRCVAVAHVDSAKEALLWELRRHYPIFPDGPSPGSQVLRTEQSVLYPQFQAGELPQTTQDTEHLRLITALAPVAAMAVPLIVHGETIGVMTLASIRSERQSAQREVRLAEELAHQAALAVEHAQLYQQA